MAFILAISNIEVFFILTGVFSVILLAFMVPVYLIWYFRKRRREVRASEEER